MIGALLSIALGVGLAAATGFRVFLPLLIAAIAARSGVLPLTDGFAWLASTPALVTLGTAAVLTPIGKVRTRTGDFMIGDGSVGKVTSKLRTTLCDIQRGRVEDPYGWVHRVL